MKPDLEERVKKFNSGSLPGQPMASHMGTHYLVNDLWRAVQELSAPITAVQSDAATVAVDEDALDSLQRRSGLEE